MADNTQPLNQLQMVQAARRYYIDDASKVQIASELGISRFKVARLLEIARESGVVRIEITDPGAVRDSLSSALAERYALRHSMVVDLEAIDTESRPSELGKSAAALLNRVVQPTDVVGLPYSRMVAATVDHLDSLPPIPIVQLSGALDLPSNAASPVDIVRDAARLVGGEAHVFYAPLVVRDCEAAKVILAEPSVHKTLSEARHCSIAVVGIGGWSGADSTLFNLASGDERAEIAKAEAVGEIAGTFFEASGSTIETTFSSRLITVNPKDLQQIPHVIAVAMGRERAATLAAGIRGGYVNSAVVDTELAQALLDLPDSPSDTSR